MSFNANKDLVFMDADQSAALSYTTDSTTATITTKQAGLQLQLPDARAAES